MAGLAFAEDLAAHPPSAIIGEDQEEPPRWEVLHLGELALSVPLALAAGFPAGTLTACPAVVFFDDGYNDGDFSVTVYTRADDAAAGRAYLDELLQRSHRRSNPFKGRVLETVRSEGFGLTFKVVDLPATSRDGVVLPAEVWEEVDRNVHGFFDALPRLEAAGLARNRGLLLEGAPGTGRTALCRAVAGELAGTTVVFCHAASVARGVRELYRELGHLSPALGGDGGC